MFATKEAMIASLLEAGVQRDFAQAIAAMSKAALRLELGAIGSEDALARGATKICGRPDLPKDVEWPFRAPLADREKRRKMELEIVASQRKWLEEEPNSEYRPTPAQIEQMEAYFLDADVRRSKPAALNFIAQFNLSELAGVPGFDLLFPTAGRLLFFYDAVDMPENVRCSERTPARLIYLASDPSDLVLRDPPEDCSAKPAIPCSYRAIVSPPPPDYAEVQSLPSADSNMEEYEDWYNSTAGNLDEDYAFHHRLGGHPTLIQSDMRSENPDGSAIGNQVLLFEISSNNEVGMMWGDSGILYVWIDREHLRQRRFDLAWVTWQCS